MAILHLNRIFRSCSQRGKPFVSPPWNVSRYVCLLKTPLTIESAWNSLTLSKCSEKTTLAHPTTKPSAIAGIVSNPEKWFVVPGIREVMLIRYPAASCSEHSHPADKLLMGSTGHAISPRKVHVLKDLTHIPRKDHQSHKSRCHSAKTSAANHRTTRDKIN